jgi:DNA-binding NarL/FixJ family response regulator
LSFLRPIARLAFVAGPPVDRLIPMRTLSIVDRPVPLAPPDDTAILLVAEHALVRAGLRAVLGGTPGLTVIAEAPDVASAIPLVSRYRPDVVLLDAPPAGDADMTALHALRREAPGTCVLSLGSEGAATEPALPCVPCTAGVVEFCATIGVLLGGRCAACALRAQCPAPGLAATLSRREQQVAVHVAAGLSSKQIAAALGIGLRTVNTYRESLARKIGGSSAAVLTRYVLEHGLDAEPVATGR